MNQRKKFCECCKIMIQYTRAAIQDHEGSHKHKQNQERELRTAHIKARKEHKNYSLEDDNMFKTIDRRGQRIGSGNQKAQQQKQQNKEDLVKRQETIAEKVVIADKESYFSGRIWILEKEDDTAKLRFRNTLTGQLKYERPIGLMLEDYEEEAWDQYEKDRPSLPVKSSQHFIKIGDWEEVKQGEGYFDRPYQNSPQPNDPDDAEDFIDIIERKVAEGVLQKKADIVKEFIIQGGPEKNFSNRLRELAEQDVDLDIPIPYIQRKHSPPKNTGLLFKKRIINTKKVVQIENFQDLQ